MKAIWHSLVQLCSQNGSGAHGLSIPHDELRLVCFDVVNICHEVTIVFGAGTFSFLEENFATTFDGTEVNFTGDLLQFGVELDETGDGNVVNGSLGFW